MALRWEDEPWVKLYTKDHPDWLELSGMARSVFYSLLRKADPAGLIHLGKSGLRGIAKLIDWPWDVLEPLLLELLADGCMSMNGERDGAVLPNFLEAQSARTNDIQRKRIQRERARASAVGGVRDVTDGHSASAHVPAVTDGHDQNRSEEIRLDQKKPPTPLQGDDFVLEAPKAKKDTPPSPPSWLPVDAWAAWLAYRRKGRAPYTPHAQRLSLGKLEKLRAQGEDPVAVLEQSIERGYPGLFPVKGADPKDPKPDNGARQRIDTAAAEERRKAMDSAKANRATPEEAQRLLATVQERL